MLVASLLVSASTYSMQPVPADLCERNPCREPREITLLIDGQRVAAPYPLGRSPILLEGAMVLLAKDEAVTLRRNESTHHENTGRPVFSLADFTVSAEMPDHQLGQYGEVLISLTLDDADESSTFKLSNHADERMAFGLSIISAQGQPFDVETCPVDPRGQVVLRIQNQVFAVMVSEMQVVDETASCADYSINDYPLLNQ